MFRDLFKCYALLCLCILTACQAQHTNASEMHIRLSPEEARAVYDQARLVIDEHIGNPLADDKVTALLQLNDLIVKYFDDRDRTDALPLNLMLQREGSTIMLRSTYTAWNKAPAGEQVELSLSQAQQLQAYLQSWQ